MSIGLTKSSSRVSWRRTSPLFPKQITCHLGENNKLSSANATIEILPETYLFEDEGKWFVEAKNYAVWFHKLQLNMSWSIGRQTCVGFPHAITMIKGAAIMEDHEWVPFSWHCPNCGKIVTGLKDESGAIKVTCRHCQLVMVRKLKSRRRDIIELFPPKGAVPVRCAYGR